MPQQTDLSELRDAERELMIARVMFNEAQDPDAVDCAIWFMAAAEARLKRLCKASTETAA